MRWLKLQKPISNIEKLEGFQLKFNPNDPGVFVSELPVGKDIPIYTAHRAILFRTNVPKVTTIPLEYGKNELLIFHK